MKWPRLVLAFSGFVLIGIAAGVGGVLIPSQLSDYHIDKVTFGLTFFAFSAGYLLGALGNGTFVSRLGVRLQLTLGASVFLVASLAVGTRPPFAALVALSVVSGAGSGVIDSGLNAFVSTLPGHTGLLNYLHAFFGVGALIGPLLASRMLVAGFPWQDVYLVLAALAAPILIGSAALLPRRVPPAADQEHGAPLALALRRAAVWIAAIFLCLYVGAEVSVGNWGFTFLVQERRQGALFAGSVVSVYWLGLTLGRFVINAVASRVGLGIAAMMYTCLAGMGGAVLLAWWGPGPALAVVGFGVLGFFLGPIFPTTIAVMPRLAPARLVPSAIGFLVGTSVVGGAIFPYVAGALAQGIGIVSLMPYMLVLAALQLGCWWMIALRIRPVPPVADPQAVTDPQPVADPQPVTAAQSGGSGDVAAASEADLADPGPFQDRASSVTTDTTRSGSAP